MPSTISVLDSTGAAQTVSLPTTAADNGRAAASASRPVALSTEDKTSLDAVTSKMEEVRALVAGTDSQLPATLGAKTGANSLSVVLASDGTLPLPTGAATQATLANIDADIGAPADASASSDTGTFSLIALIKRMLTKLPALGQTTMAGSQPVVIASNQTDVPQRVNAFNFPISVGNSSTTQLAAGATFTGTIESAADLPSLSILLTSDQPTTITVRQFIDVGGTFAAPDIVFYVPAGAAFSRSLPINGNFYRVLAQNTGASTTTTFNLNCALGTLGDADSTGVQPVTEPPLVITGASAQTATVNNILTPVSGTAALNVSGFRTASIQVVSTGTGGTFIFEQSNDGTNWVALPVFNAALVTGVPITAAITATASQIVYTFPVRCNFLRLRIATTITGGSIQAFTRLSTDPWSPAAMLVASSVAANLNATVSGTVTANIGTGSLAAGTNAIGDVGVQYRANNTGAASVVSVLSPATPAAATIKASAGRLLGWQLQNSSAGLRSVKVFNATAPTLGTTSATFEIDIPAGGTMFIELPGGIGFATAMTYSVTSAKGLTDNTATGLAANDVSGAFFFA